MCDITTDVTPNLLVTTYKDQPRPLFYQDDTAELPNSPTLNSNHGENSMISISETQMESHGTMEETPSQASGQQQKRQTYEEAQLHQQKLEHEWSLKQQKK
ncbi:hypothetical protein O181_056527 [Austropuccinia psidii MF-1]|uniref:Uncharacterized protein n=1 Tax=Austropuccinia psidii MF-1 TaxID=1389203 RepID=A0A9Q3EFW5_9BASI|nr:hypothetical protein [Austropuccinia psidii MF-1]